MTEAAPSVPELQPGDRLTRDEFERRCAAMPQVKKAELVEGVVYMPSPVSPQRHGEPAGIVAGWLTHYAAKTPGVQQGVDASVLLDLENMPQPDALLRVRPGCGGQSRDARGYVDGAPELVVEVAASSVSYDLHDKLRAGLRRRRRRLSFRRAPRLHGSARARRRLNRGGGRRRHRRVTGCRRRCPAAREGGGSRRAASRAA